MNKKILALVISLACCGQAFSEQAYSMQDFKASYASFNQYAINKQWKEAEPFAKQSYEIGLALFGEESKNTANLAYNYGLNLKDLRRLDEAEKILHESVGYFENSYGKEAQELIPVLTDLGNVIARPFTGAKSLMFYNRALELTDRHYGKESIKYGSLSIDVGVMLLIKAGATQAKKYLENGYTIIKEKQGSHSAKARWALFNLGKYELTANNDEKAISDFKEFLGSSEEPDSPSNKLELAAHGFLVAAYEKLDMSDEATQHCLAIGKMTPFTSKQDYLPLVKAAPFYPERAARKGKTGFTIVEYDVDKMGFVKNVTVVENKGHKSFASTSVKAAERFRYAPAFKDGKAVVTSGVQNRFIYELDK